MAIALPAARRAGGCGLFAAPDRPVTVEGDQPSSLGRKKLSPRRDRAARRKLCRQGGRAGSASSGTRTDRRRSRGRIRSEEHTSELQSLMRISYAVLCLKKKK